MKVILSDNGARIIDVIVDDKNWYLEFRYRLKDHCFMLGYMKREEEIGIEYFYENKVGARFMDILTDFGRVSDYKKFKEKIERICNSDFEFVVDIPKDSLARQELGLPNKKMDDPLTRIKQLENRIGSLEKRYKDTIVYPAIRWGTPVDKKPDWMDQDTFNRSKHATPIHREPWGEYGYPYEVTSDTMSTLSDCLDRKKTKREK